MNKDFLPKIRDILVKLGLSKNQEKFYLTIINRGEATLNEIIEESGLKRPTAYRVFQELESRGLVVRDFSKKYNQKITVTDPRRLVALAGNRQRKMRRLELEIKDLLPELNVVFSEKKIKPKVELYDDEAGYVYLADKSLEAREKTIFYLGDIQDFYKIFDKEYDEQKYIPSRLKNKVLLKWLLPKSKETEAEQKRDKQLLRETRLIDDKYKMNASVMVYDNYVVFFSSHKEKVALSITSKYLAELQKNIFNIIWDMVE
jgi:sugar-specific transcriptional regulator TrmB